MPMPYVVLNPGPTVNTLGTDDNDHQIIVLKGRQANATTGHLNLTTVNITTKKVTAFQALIGWLQHDRVVVPRSAIYPPGQSEKQINEEDTQQFASSQDNATAAAFCELGYPRGFGVLSVDADAGAKNVLKAFDQLVSLDGAPIDSSARLTAELAKHQPGDTVTVAFKRLGKPMATTITLSKPDTGETV